MTSEIIFERIQNVFRDVFDREDMAITAETSALNTKGWDSLNHIILIGAIENEFQMRLSLGEIAELKDVQGLVDLISINT
jgi:acyl carrier protein